MSAFLSGFIAVGVLGALAYFITFLPWPDLPTGFLSALSDAVNYIWSFNALIPIDTFWNLARITIGLLLALQVFRLVGRIYEAITGNRAPVQ